MNSEVKITHSDWTSTQTKLTKMEDDIESIKVQLDSQQVDIDKLETNIMAYRFALREEIQNEIRPVIEQVTKLSEENDKLSKEVIKNANDKYKIVAVGAGALVMTILTYIVTLFLNTFFN